ncbi:MAG: membrane protein insertase YidC [Pseudomonadales bacterium]|nr:membrane protein insertase YidC [Pseudomonadales bacterium]
MDWQRTLLIAALAVVSYLMILQWQKDYVQAPGADQARTEAAAAAPSGTDQQASADSAVAGDESYSQSYPQGAADDVPVAPVDNSGGSDVPVSPVSADQATTASAGTPSGDLILVETDLMRVRIDPLGGDIVHVGLKQYPVSIDRPDVPFTLLESGGDILYVAQSGLIGPDGPDGQPGGRPLYRSDQSRYRMQGDSLTVTLSYEQADGTEIRKEFRFQQDHYVIDVNFVVQNRGADPWQGLMYGQIKRDSSPDPGLNASVGFGLPTYLGGAYWDQDKRYNKVDFEDMAESPLNKKIPGGWLAMIQHYFMSAWIPDQEQTHHYRTRVANGFNIIGFTTPKATVAPGDSYRFNARFYAGPKIQERLKALLPGKGMDLAIDFGPLFFISEILFQVLDFFHNLTGNWGFAIILLTILVKLIFFYPSALSYRSMAKMRKVAPELTRLREQYADDRQKLSQEMMNLYKKEKINPLGGCLPILLQMPVFLALYWALLESVELRQAPFLFWIEDLSAMDPFFVLPIIMGASMWVQQKLNPAPPDPMQAKVMQFLPVIFTVMFLWFPAGLVLYWVTNNVLSIAQQYVITKRIEAGSS